MTENERIAVMETQIRHINEKLDENSQKLDEIHDAFMQAKGARWMIALMAAMGGAFTGFFVKYLPILFGPLPK